jgi:hypothetical protein
VSCACDAQKDGVTNPAAINGNMLASELAAAGRTDGSGGNGFSATADEFAICALAA